MGLTASLHDAKSFYLIENLLMKKIVISLAALLTTASVYANCFGSANMYTCNDASGNSYNVQKFGNTTNVQGYNSATGSSWNQSSNTLGNTTYINGSTNGRAWNETIQTMPGMTTYSGTDSRGNSFNRTCTAFGCN